MNQKTLGLITVFTGVLFIIALGFAILFGVKLGGVNKQKGEELGAALTAQSKQLNAAFQSEKEETTTKYVADEIFGSFEFSYPKVWSTNVTQEVGAAKELVFMGDPNLITVNKEDATGPFTALRVQVYQDKYTNKLRDTENSNKNVKNPMKESDITVSDIKGKKFIGTDEKSGKQFAYVILPLRDKTLYIGTDDLTNFTKNYDTILATFKISK